MGRYSIMVDRNDALFREVDEELRREQLEKLWKRYSNHILIGAAAIVACVAGYKVWEARRAAAAEAAGAKLIEARQLITDGKVDDGIKALGSLANVSSTGVATVARLQVVAALQKAGKPAEALAQLEAISKDGSVDPLFKDFARLQAAALRSGEADFTEMQNRLTDLTTDKNPWSANARELLGVAALKAGKVDVARSMFQLVMGDSRTPTGVAERVQLLMTQVTAAELAKPAMPAQPADKDAAGAPAKK